LRIAAVNPVARPAFGDIPDLVGRDFGEVMRILWPKAHADKVVDLFRQVLRTGEPHIDLEHMEQRADRGVIEYYESRLNRLPLPGGRYGVVCYFRDISATVRTREALRDADRRKDEFIATLSHELRNPLAPLRNSLQLMRLTGRAEGEAAPIHEMMERQVNYLVRLVDDLLEISRISRGTFELRKSRVDVGSVVRNAIETSEPLIQAGGHRLETRLPDAPLWLDGDPVRLAQVLANLLNNSAKYTDAGGRIWVTVSRQGQWVEISVRDNGWGISPEVLPKVFDMFTRGDRSSTRMQDGLGIGLALATRLAEMHGGTITVRSDGPGKGSEFTVRLPLAETQQAEPHQAGNAGEALGQRRILVVDDNFDAASSLAMILELLGAKVRTAQGGAEALEVFDAFDPVAVLLDIGMPGMDGYEVARRLRESFPGRSTLVALTGWGQEDDRRRAREAGFDHHLTKPADIGALQSLLASIDARAMVG
jgi:signal transduction histidine kinase/CheY-like chemotaxis protein